jgi:hypothetical protein
LHKKKKSISRTAKPKKLDYFHRKISNIHTKNATTGPSNIHQEKKKYFEGVDHSSPSKRNNFTTNRFKAGTDLLKNNTEKLAAPWGRTGHKYYDFSRSTKKSSNPTDRSTRLATGKQ